MNIEDLREYCISLPHVEESFPFDDETLVMKIGGKMFAYIPLEKTDACINLKCDPELAIELREKYNSVQPGFHMNKTHWNTVFVTTEISENQIKKWIKHSYDLVKAKLPKRSSLILPNQVQGKPLKE